MVCGFPFLARLLCVSLAPAQIPVSTFWFQILVWTCSARFSVSGFQFPAGLSLDCAAPAWIPVSGLRFWFRLAPPASPFPASKFQPVSCSITQRQLGFRLLVSSFRFLFGFLVGVSCDCFAPAWIPVSGFRFRFGLAPLACD